MIIGGNMSVHQYIGETLPVPPIVMVETKRAGAAVLAAPHCKARPHRITIHNTSNRINKYS
jgi:hypothetical protein